MANAPSPGQLQTLNGVQIYFEVHGTGEPLILLHGFSGSSQDWMPSITGWGSRFQLIVVDMRGHGRSSILSSSFRHQEAANDIFALLDQRDAGRIFSICCGQTLPQPTAVIVRGTSSASGLMC